MGSFQPVWYYCDIFRIQESTVQLNTQNMCIHVIVCICTHYIHFINSGMKMVSQFVCLYISTMSIVVQTSYYILCRCKMYVNIFSQLVSAILNDVEQGQVT